MATSIAMATSIIAFGNLDCVLSVEIFLLIDEVLDICFLIQDIVHVFMSAIFLHELRYIPTFQMKFTDQLFALVLHALLILHDLYDLWILFEHFQELLRS